MERYVEFKDRVPVVENADVVVCGGGPAGVAAAVAAARSGARTRLLELGGSLGGIWTRGLLAWIIDSANKPGLMREILDRLALREGVGDGNKVFSPLRGQDFSIHPDLMKVVLEEMCLEAGVVVQLHTRVVAAVTTAGRINYVVTESKSGRQAWGGKVFVDATGDGDLSALAGCGFDLGKPDSGETQAMTMLALVAGIKPEDVGDFTNNISSASSLEIGENFRKVLEGIGIVPSYGCPSMSHIKGDLFLLGVNHEYGVNPLDAAQVTEATIRARREVHRVVDALRASGGIWKDLQIVCTAEHIGVREGRRVHGLYRVTVEDLLNGTEHADAVCRVTMPVDVHSVDPRFGTAYSNEGVETKPYDIPLRALIAKDVDNLLMAGRCISGDFYAHASYRVSGNAVTLGQAAGVAAALAAHSATAPKDVPWPEVKAAINAVSQSAAYKAPMEA